MREPIESILAIFTELSAVPRKSKSEIRAVEWLIRRAEERGLRVSRDLRDNIVIRVPARGCRSGPVTVLQGHIDMVCEKIPGSAHDFDTDPIVPVRKGDWITAEGTTLGADNGIAAAMALAAADDDSLVHPPLELLFTTDEESGMTGAKNLDPSALEGKVLLNLDSEDEGVFTVGCAGGRDCLLSWRAPFTGWPGGAPAMVLCVGGLTGGHSGVDIHKPLANANKLLSRALSELLKETEIRLVSLDGGSARNAIARDAAAVLIPEKADTLAGDFVKRIESVLMGEYPLEKNLRITAEPAAEQPARVLPKEESRRFVDLLQALPHGVIRMSQDVEGLVETSCNLAVVRTETAGISITMSLRSSSPTVMDALFDRIEGMARLFGIPSAVTENRYPAWRPDMRSPLLARCTGVYRRLYGREPTVEVIHAGLECGVIGGIYPGMDMISFGPTIKGAHSPDERLHVPSLERVWRFLTELLADLCVERTTPGL